MSSIYKDEILRIEDPVTHKPALSTSRLSEILGKDRQNFAEKWREGRLTKAMQGTIEDNLPRIHEETRLHSYGWSLFFRLRVLRDTEDRARDRIKSASESRSLEKIDRAYEYGIREVVASFIPTITKALSLVDEENADTALSQDDLTDVYLAGAVLHTALIVWEDAADALAALGERDTLDFELLNSRWLCERRRCGGEIPRALLRGGVRAATAGEKESQAGCANSQGRGANGRWHHP